MLLKQQTCWENNIILRLESQENSRRNIMVRKIIHIEEEKCNGSL